MSFGDLTTQDVDPAVAPDESFIVFGSMHPGPNAHERLFIAVRDGAGSGKPVGLGGDRTAPIKLPRTRTQAEEDLARIAAWDNGNQNIWSVSLAPWLDAPKPL